MELDITEFFESECPNDYQASIAEIGENASLVTWQNALESATDYEWIKSADDRQAIIEHFAAYGDFNEKDLASWSDSDLIALMIQDISYELKNFFDLAKGDWEKWGELYKDGVCNGCLYGGPLSTDGRVYFYFGN